MVILQYNLGPELYIDVEGERVKFPFHILSTCRCWGPAFNRAAYMVAASVVQGPALHFMRIYQSE